MIKPTKHTTPDETMIPDARAGLSPREMVQEKLLRTLRAPPQTPHDGERKSMTRRPARASEK